MYKLSLGIVSRPDHIRVFFLIFLNLMLHEIEVIRLEQQTILVLDHQSHTI